MGKYGFYNDFDSPSTHFQEYSLTIGCAERINLKLSKVRLYYPSKFFNQNDMPEPIGYKIDEENLIEKPY